MHSTQTCILVSQNINKYRIHTTHTAICAYTSSTQFVLSDRCSHFVWFLAKFRIFSTSFSTNICASHRISLACVVLALNSISKYCFIKYRYYFNLEWNKCSFSLLLPNVFPYFYVLNRIYSDRKPPYPSAFVMPQCYTYTYTIYSILCHRIKSYWTYIHKICRTFSNAKRNLFK